VGFKVPPVLEGIVELGVPAVAPVIVVAHNPVANAP
jgi:hypothetical protein